jgi:hypothetical protein
LTLSPNILDVSRLSFYILSCLFLLLLQYAYPGYHPQEAGVSEQRVSQESVEDFCKHAHGIVRVTTRSIAQEVSLPQAQEAAVETVREVLEDDLYQDPMQVSGVNPLAFCVAQICQLHRSPFLSAQKHDASLMSMFMPICPVVMLTVDA